MAQKNRIEFKEIGSDENSGANFLRFFIAVSGKKTRKYRRGI
jgi:hypothetical protein